MPKSQSSAHNWLRTLVEYKNLADDFYLHFKDQEASVKRKRSESYFEFELEPHLEEITKIICDGDSILLEIAINILAADSGNASESLSSFGYDIFECNKNVFISIALKHNKSEKLEIASRIEAGYFSSHSENKGTKNMELLSAVDELKN